METADHIYIYEVLDLMEKYGVAPNEVTYEILIMRYAPRLQIEPALQLLTEMSLRGLIPTLATITTIIMAAGKLGYPRLALDLAGSFEKNSHRRLDGEVWVECLISSAENLYVSVQAASILV